MALGIPHERTELVAASALIAPGVTEDDARVTAEVLVSPDAREKPFHGLMRLPRIVDELDHGNVDPGGDIAVVRDGGAAVAPDAGARPRLPGERSVAADREASVVDLDEEVWAAVEELADSA